MTRYILGRLAIVVPVLLIMTVLTFVLVSLIPGDAATSILGQDATPQRIAELTHQLGLDLPLWQQYGNWLSDAVQGDLGTSLFTGDQVARTLSQRVLPTVYLAGFAALVAAAIGVAFGTMAAIKGGWLGRALDIIGTLGISFPNFWIALVLVFFVAGELRWFPALGYTDLGQDAAGWAAHLVLPVASLAVAGVALIARQTRDAVAEALSRDFMRFMQSNGIPRSSLIVRHGLRYAAIPIVSSVTATFINLFGGTVALEAVFSIPGLGSLVQTSTLQHDLLVVQGAVLAFTLVILAVTILSDIAYAFLNPKVRTS